MTLTVRLFGPQAALARRREVELTLRDAPDGSPPTCADVLEKLGEAEPALADSLPGSRLAVNHAFAEPGDPLQPGDEIALIGMVAGG